MNTQDILDRAHRQVQERRATTARRADRSWQWAFCGLALTLIGGVWFLPGGTLAARLHLVVQGVCAQAHFLFLGPLQLPLCARNTGIYAGFLGSLLYLIALGRGRAGRMPPWPLLTLLGFGVIAMAVDGTNSLLLDMGNHNLYPPNNILRLITGLLMGTGMAVFLLLLFNISLRANVRTEQRVLGGWIEYGGALLADALLFGLIWTGPSVLFYPLAIFSVLGIVGVLFMTNVFVVAMVSGFENRLRRLPQLARPATFALIMTACELGLLAWLRSWMESSMPM
jgi:uncharacterized membrane protein